MMGRDWPFVEYINNKERSRAMGTTRLKLKMPIVLRPLYTVWTEDERMLRPGDEITCFRGEKWVFESCTHPRKIYARKAGSKKEWGQEFYPSVFDLEIR